MSFLYNKKYCVICLTVSFLTEFYIKINTYNNLAKYNNMYIIKNIWYLLSKYKILILLGDWIELVLFFSHLKNVHSYSGHGWCSHSTVTRDSDTSLLSSLPSLSVILILHFFHKMKSVYVSGRWKEGWRAKTKGKGQQSLSLYQRLFCKLVNIFWFNLSDKDRAIRTICSRGWDMWFLAWYFFTTTKIGMGFT